MPETVRILLCAGIGLSAGIILALLTGPRRDRQRRATREEDHD